MNNPLVLFTLVIGFLSLLDLVLVLVLLFRFNKYRQRQEELFEGENVKDLESLVLQHKKTLSNHHKNLKELGHILEELVEKSKLNIQKVGLVRYNPFPEAGGNMSFVLALLDGKGSGIVVSSLHGREGTRIYAKNLEKGQSKYRLTEEEKKAIQEANNY